MESAALRRPPQLTGVLQLGLIALLVVLAAIGWALTDDRMQGMDAGPGTDLGGLGWFVGVWVVMMAAMMFPSIWPMVTIYARVQEGKRERGEEVQVGTTSLFVAGYLVTWTAAGLVGYALIEAGKALSIDAFSWDEGGPYLAGGVIVAAAVYQLTPIKDVCLSKCRSPLDFMLGYFRQGYGGALRMGVEHGGWCVGCCWALMAALFAVGVMSVGWMIFVAGLIAVEKMLPWKAVANRGIAVLLLVLGVSVAVWPERVPGLTLPDSSGGHGTMMQMEGGPMGGDSMDGAKPDEHR
jgi:predicted metal-binding membrane protein